MNPRRNRVWQTYLALAVALALISLSASCSKKAKPFDKSIIKEGDLIFTRLDYEKDSEGLSFLLPNLPVNHVGIIVKDPKHKRLVVLESWKQVRLTPLDEFIKRACAYDENGKLKYHDSTKIYIKRLTNLNKEQLERGIKWGFGRIYIPYDRMYDWKTDYRYYNSEFIIKMLNIAKLIPVPDMKPLSAYINGRKPIPLQIKMLKEDTPVALVDTIWELPILTTVFSGTVANPEKK